jgi:UDP-N-acetylglucosamine transferase subunit ALG13
VTPLTQREAHPDVLVTVGTDHHPFDRLVHWVDRWLGAQEEDVQVFAQTGSSAAPRLAEWTPLVPFDDLAAAIARATTVVCHGGGGTIMLARSLSKRPVVVPRLCGLGEAVDDHQVAFAERLAAAGEITLVEDEPTLHAVLDASLRGDVEPARPSDGGHERAVQKFEELVEDLFRRAGRGMRTAGAGRHVR